MVFSNSLHPILLLASNTLNEVPKLVVDERDIKIENIVAIIVAIIGFSGLILSLIKWWKKSSEDFTKFRTQTNLKILEIEARISTIETMRREDMKTIGMKLESYQNENKQSHNRLYENINRNQREFYNQIIGIISPKNENQNK